MASSIARYKSLGHGSIRLLKPFVPVRGKPEGMISYALLEDVRFHESDAVLLPLYTALSYCWGSETDLSTIEDN